MEKTKNYFKELYDIGLNEKTKEKNGLAYLNWAIAWAELKQRHPEANYEIHTTPEGRPWFSDGKTCWVAVTVTVNSISHTVFLPIMDFKNKSIPAENVTSVDANKSWQRCFVKACAMHGLGTYIYAQLADSEENLELNSLRKEAMAHITKKCALSDNAKKRVGELCREADEDANGDPNLIEDVSVLEDLVKKLKAVRK